MFIDLTWKYYNGEIGTNEHLVHSEMINCVKDIEYYMMRLLMAFSIKLYKVIRSHASPFKSDAMNDGSCNFLTIIFSIGKMWAC